MPGGYACGDTGAEVPHDATEEGPLQATSCSDERNSEAIGTRRTSRGIPCGAHRGLMLLKPYGSKAPMEIGMI